MMFENIDWTKSNFRVDPQMVTFYRLGKDTTVLELTHWDDMLTAYMVENNVMWLSLLVSHLKVRKMVQRLA